MTRKELEESCPEGYTVVIPGQKFNMLNATEFWRIHEHHAEPHLTRIPQDMMESWDGVCVGRVPKEWGRCLYYKVA